MAACTPPRIHHRSMLATLGAALFLFFMIALAPDAGVCASQVRRLETFDSIDLRLPAHLYLSQGESQVVRLIGEKALLEKCSTIVAGGRLIVESDNRTIPWPETVLEIHVTIVDIRALTISAAAHVTGQTPLKTDKLQLTINGSGRIGLEIFTREVHTSLSGSGEIELAGSANLHGYDISGAGNLRAGDLETEQTRVLISGSGQCDVFATDQLRVQITGSGTVHYRGNPVSIEQSISGAGMIIKTGP